MLLRQKSGGSFAQNSIRHTAWDVLAQFTSFLQTPQSIWSTSSFPFNFKKQKGTLKLSSSMDEVSWVASFPQATGWSQNSIPFLMLCPLGITQNGGIMLILIGQIDWTYCVWLKRLDLNHIHSFDNYKHANSFEANCQSPQKYSGIKDIWAQSAT